MLRPKGWGVGWYLLLVMLLVTPCVVWAEGEWPQRLPDGQPSRFDWPSTPPYWRETRDDRGFLFLRPEGFVWGNIWRNGEISYFLARWKTVSEIRRPVGRVQFLVAVDQYYCGGSFTDHHATFRLLDINYDWKYPLLTLDVATGVHPPPSPLSIGRDELWDIFKAEARHSYYKDEGPFRPSSREDMPQWFLDLISATWGKGRFDCGYAPP